jgi:hypothetical protein
MIDAQELMRQAAADDAARVLAQCADRLERVAGKLDALDDAKLRRIVTDLRHIAARKRPAHKPAPVATPADLKGLPPC